MERVISLKGQRYLILYDKRGNPVKIHIEKEKNKYFTMSPMEIMTYMKDITEVKVDVLLEIKDTEYEPNRK
jgi:hypothetical protein